MGNRIYRRKLVWVRGITDREIAIDWKDVRGMRLRYNSRYRTFMASVPPGTSEDAAMAWLTRNVDWMLQTLRKAESVEHRHDEVDEEAYTHFMRSRLPAIIDRCERLTGQHASAYTVKLMSSRWGSANPKTRAISLNRNLAAYGDDCVSYVVVHELMHFLEPNHSARFWALVERYCPDWRKHRAALRH